MSDSRENVHNFAAGPSPLPTPVLQKAAEGLLNYNGTGMGVCELSHRGKDFKAIIEGAECKLAVPCDYIADSQPISENC
jgi:phosphoserine aminotransferase